MDVEEIQRRARKGPLILLSRRAISLVVSLAATFLVARLIGPRAYGLAAMSNVIFALGEMFRDFGLTSALMRKGEISYDEMTFLFWFNVVTTIIIAGIIAASAHLIAIYYHEPIVSEIIFVATVGFVLGGFTMQHRALLSRDLKFSAIATIDTIALLLGFGLSLALAVIRRDVWALVFGNLATSVVSGLGNLVASRWRPGRPSKLAGAREVLSFGANASLFSFSVFASQNAAAFLIGHFLTAGLLGQYNRATTLLAMPTQNLVEPLTQAVLPVMTRLRKYPELYKKEYLKLVESLCLILFPLCVVLCFAAPAIVESLLGKKWAMAGFILAMLSPTLASMALGYSVSDLFVTQNRSAALRTVGICEMVVRVAAIYMGVQMGIIGAAIGFGISAILAPPFRILVAGRHGPVSAMDHLRAMAPALPLALGALAGCLAAWLSAVKLLLPSEVTAVALCLSGGFCGLIAGMASSRSRVALARVFQIFVSRKAPLPALENVVTE